MSICVASGPIALGWLGTGRRVIREDQMSSRGVSSCLRVGVDVRGTPADRARREGSASECRVHGR